MTAMERFANSIVVPVVVLDKAEDAVPTARAMLAGGIDTMEITFRTACAPEAIRAVAENCPEVLVGAGTVLNLEQCKLALEMGAKFIVSPGFSEEVVGYCVEHGVPVAPGCVTPTEIMSAMKYGLKMVKFFPSNVYGGLKAMKNLSAPFVGMKFLPTGGVNSDNIKEYIDAMFGLTMKEGNSSVFAGKAVELMKSPYLGANGHIAIGTPDVAAAVADLEGRGFQFNKESAKYKADGTLNAIYLADEICGFAVHLVGNK